jgi:hypothetical protein
MALSSWPGFPESMTDGTMIAGTHAKGFTWQAESSGDSLLFHNRSLSWEVTEIL